MNSDSLPFSKPKQAAILGYLLTVDKFFLQAQNKIRPSWFLDVYAAKVYAAKQAFVARHGRVPLSLAELQDSQDFSIETPDVRNKMNTAIGVSQAEKANYGLDAILPELTLWLKCRIFHEAMGESEKLFNAGKLDAAAAMLSDRVRAFQDANFDEGQEKDWDNYIQQLVETKEELKHAVTWGLDAMDRLLLPEAVSGGLLKKDATCVMAPINVGKSMVLATVTRHNVMQGKSVLYIPLEGRDQDLQDRLTTGMLGVTRADIYGTADHPGMYTTEAGRKEIGLATAVLKKFCTFMPISKAGVSVEEVIAIIRRKTDEFYYANNRPYDLVVCDYPAILNLDLAKNVQMQYRTVQETIYRYFAQLAKELNVHALLAVQTNREGSRINQHQRGKEDRLLTMEDVHEAWGPLMWMANVVSVNRDPRAEAERRLTYYICKSRASEKGFAVTCRTDYTRGTAHSNELGATWYRGTQTMVDRMEGLLTQYLNGGIPPEALKELNA